MRLEVERRYGRAMTMLLERGMIAVVISAFATLG